MMRLVCPTCSTVCTVEVLDCDSFKCPSCGTTLTVSKPTMLLNSTDPPFVDQTFSLNIASLHLQQEEQDTELPERLGRYPVKRLLGSGSYGQVYLCFDPELKRQVAVKVPHLMLRHNDKQLTRFLQEARLAASLKHPGIVTIHEVQRQDEQGQILIVMEFVEGLSLRAEMSHAPMAPVRAARIASRVAAALHYAHKRGLIHRDLKPGNILLDEDGQAKVADFGLAVHEDMQGDLRGQIAGTPAYMAPEQVRGEAHRLDGRTDVWSLGVVFYEMLAGRRPFSGDRDQLYDEVLHRDPKPPRQIHDTIPRELEEICLRCLAKRMTDRYTATVDIHRDLEAWLAVYGSDTESTGSGDSRTSYQRRGRVKTLLMACGGLALLVLLWPMAQWLHGLTQESQGEGERGAVARSGPPTPGRWNSLLDRPPVPVIWHSEIGSNHWSVDPIDGSMLIQSRGLSQLQLGDFDYDSYSYSIGIAQPAALTGSIGLYFNHGPITFADGRPAEFCEMILIRFYTAYRQATRQDEKVCELQRVYRVLDEIGGAMEGVHRVEVASYPLPLAAAQDASQAEREEMSAMSPMSNESRLEIVVERGVLQRVVWRGRPIQELVQEFNLEERVAEDPHLGAPYRPPRNSRIGVAVEGGSARVLDARFMPHRSSQL